MSDLIIGLANQRRQPVAKAAVEHVAALFASYTFLYADTRVGSDRTKERGRLMPRAGDWVTVSFLGAPRSAQVLGWDGGGSIWLDDRRGTIDSGFSCSPEDIINKER